jgi:tetratricopeptide (TPR) repeat protein
MGILMAIPRTNDWFLLGIRSYLHNEFDLAITYFDKVLDLEPKNAKAYANRADVYLELEEYPEAHNDYLMAAHLGGQPMQQLLDEFLQEMRESKIMDEAGQFIHQKNTKPKASYLKTVDESQLGDDMHIVDLSQDSWSEEDDF